jgi:L-lactate dehydrogenase complex protein LldG
LNVEHHVEPTADAVRARVAAIVGHQPVLRWDVDHLPYGVGDLLPDAADAASPRDRQAAAAVGVTGCDAAIAETGSLALITGRGKPRAASLLPPAHLAIVRTDQLRATMGEFFRERAADLAVAANCTFVTGPSRTADIELTLTVGVHGPGRVVIIIGP